MSYPMSDSLGSAVSVSTEWTREEMEQQTIHMSGAEKVGRQSYVE